MTAEQRTGKPWDAQLARRLVMPLSHGWLTPNHLTALSLLVGLGAGFLYAAGTRPAVDLAALLFMCSALIDHADGELARMNDQHTRFGYYFDHITGFIIYIVLFTGMGIGLRQSALGQWAIPAGILAGIAVSVIFALRFEIERRQGTNTFAQPTIGGFEIEDIMYLIGPITWLGGAVSLSGASRHRCTFVCPMAGLAMRMHSY